MLRGALSMWAHRSPTLMSYLLALALILAVPLAAYAVLVTVKYAQAERGQLEQRVYEANRELTAIIEREVIGQVAALRALASAPELWNDDLSEFYMHALSLVSVQKAHFVLLDRSGKQLVNTRVPWTSMLPSCEARLPNRQIAGSNQPYAVSG